jgi:transposase
MDRDCFWLNEEQFSRLEPLLPTDTRGVPRADDRRVISGIIHVLKSGRALGRRAGSLWAAQDTVQSLCALGGERGLDRCLSRAGLDRWPAGGAADRFLGGQSPPLRLGR